MFETYFMEPFIATIKWKLLMFSVLTYTKTTKHQNAMSSLHPKPKQLKTFFIRKNNLGNTTVISHFKNNLVKWDYFSRH